jgi:hypothetical protein
MIAMQYLLAQAGRYPIFLKASITGVWREYAACFTSTIAICLKLWEVSPLPTQSSISIVSLS